MSALDKQGIYIAGPMTGLPNFNFESFDEAKHWLQTAMGRENVISPADMDRELGLEPDENGDIQGFDYKAAIRRCCDAICDCDAIYMLIGWENSKGARMEHALAVCLGMDIIYE